MVEANGRQPVVNQPPREGRLPPRPSPGHKGVDFCPRTHIMIGPKNGGRSHAILEQSLEQVSIRLSRVVHPSTQGLTVHFGGVRYICRDGVIFGEHDLLGTVGVPALQDKIVQGSSSIPQGGKCPDLQATWKRAVVL
jgi:hypothetical protein